MQEHLGQSVLVENVVGTEGSVGPARVARAANDGYLIGLGTFTTHVVNGLTMALPYDVVADFAPIALLSTQPMIIVGRRDLPVKNLKELIAWLKANPNKAIQGSTGLKGSTHLAGVLFQQITGTRFLVVPYRGTTLAMQDLVAGRIDLIFDLSSLSMPLVRAGKIRAFAIMGKERLPGMPDVPTADEAGLPGFHIAWWSGLWSRAGTPKDVIAKLNAAVIGALASESLRKRLTYMGYQVYPSRQQTPEALAALQKAEMSRWLPVVRKAGMKAN
jgi:tripartite-type tricarboxylate transporter receptor subunit TctC